MYEVRRLKYMPYATATIQVYDCAAILQSYSTLVAAVCGDWIYCRGLYSATTRRHIGAFAKEYGLTYYDFKNVAGEGYWFNRTTGEIVEGTIYDWEGLE